MKKKTHLPFFILSCVAAILVAGCSPLKSSPHEEKHQMELTLHEVQTNLDDVRHDLNCFQTEQHILDGRINNQENALLELKRQYLEKQLAKIDHLFSQIALLENKYQEIENKQKSTSLDVENLVHHANETSAALSQYREKIQEVETVIGNQDRKFQELAKLRSLIETISTNQFSDTTVYRVKAGDSLEKIAKKYETHVETIKKLNHLKEDLIVIGQELQIPQK